MILYLTPEVREAALDLRALRRKVNESGRHAYRWIPAQAKARERLVLLSLEEGVTALSVASAPLAEISVPAVSSTEADLASRDVVENATSPTAVFDEYVSEIQNPR
jgi:hypothetical protein